MGKKQVNKLLDSCQRTSYYCSNMVDREQAKELFNQGFSYAEIGDRMGVSRQRIHQVIKGYKNMGRSRREEKYRDFGLCTSCNSAPSEVLHHKDYDNKNDDMSNLERLCRKCHAKRHTGRTKRKVKTRNPYAPYHGSRIIYQMMTGKRKFPDEKPK